MNTLCNDRYNAAIEIMELMAAQHRHSVTALEQAAVDQLLGIAPFRNSFEVLSVLVRWVGAATTIKQICEETVLSESVVITVLRRMAERDFPLVKVKDPETGQVFYSVRLELDSALVAYAKELTK